MDALGSWDASSDTACVGLEMSYALLSVIVRRILSKGMTYARCSSSDTRRKSDNQETVTEVGDGESRSRRRGE